MSVRVNLSDSNILNSGYCDIKLLIDTDGDDDFTTGTIIEISATSIDGNNNAYFDLVDFEHEDTFTFGIVDAPTIQAVAVQPSTCGASDGQIQFTFENVPDGNYTISYDGSSFNNVAVASNAATVTGLAAANYTNLSITVNGCTSQQDPDAVLTSPDAPTIQAVAVQPSTCGASDNGSVSIEIGDADFPITVQLNNMTPLVFNSDSFSIDNLSSGDYEMSITDDTGCETNTSFTILPSGPNLGASIEVVYFCDNNLTSNTIDVTLLDQSMSNDVLYALDSTEPNDFILSPDFENIGPGNHSLFILHNNGCIGEVLFEVDNFEPLELILTNNYVNQITANVTGGTAPYTYFFDDNEGTSSNTFNIGRSGTFTVRVIDSNGCEMVQSIAMNLIEISIPDFFTPNFDGQNDYWAPRNTELFPDIETYIFDRYGRKIRILGPSGAWDGEYDSKPMPSGDYWYIVKLNDGSGREFVGHFTLYR
ncbi:MAG: T9SS type B sorting domain-containing protein [Algicola sp.]|nr:T9SS type B sorting domain-containing protein [Algicola sp.]